MDPNLDKIKEDNMHLITHGRVQKAISQAQDYLTYVIGHDQEQINQELDTFVTNVKEIRRQSRGQKRKPEGRKQ